MLGLWTGSALADLSTDSVPVHVQFMKKRQDIIDTEVKCTGPSHGGAL